MNSHRQTTDFISNLQAAVDDLEKTIVNQVYEEGIRTAATAAISEVCSSAFGALHR